MKFTEREIKVLKPPTGPQVFIYDTDTKGLALGLSPKGKRTFYLARWIEGKSRRQALGVFGKGEGHMTLREARDEVSRLLSEFSKGAPPAATAPRRGSLTVGAFYDQYMDGHVRRHCKPLTVASYEGIYKKHLAGWKERKAQSIQRDDVLDLQAEINSNAGPVAANRAVTLLRAVFNHAELSGKWHRNNPARRVKPYRETPVERFLGDTDTEEPGRFIKAVLGQPDTLQAVFFTQLFTGQRKTQVHSMKWTDLDFDRKVWRIPEILKGKRPLQVPLVPELADRLAALERKGEYVFPGERGAAHMGDPRKPWAKVLKDAEIEGLTQHDLRRTLASTLRRLGFSRDLIADILGQSSANNVTAGYLHSDAELTAERRALEAAFDELTRGTALNANGGETDRAEGES